MPVLAQSSDLFSSEAELGPGNFCPARLKYDASMFVNVLEGKTEEGGGEAGWLVGEEEGEAAGKNDDDDDDDDDDEEEEEDDGGEEGESEGEVREETQEAAEEANRKRWVMSCSSMFNCTSCILYQTKLDHK